MDKLNPARVMPVISLCALRKSKRRWVSSAVSVEAMERRQLLSSTVTTIAAPSSELLGQSFAVTATVTSGGAPVQGGTVSLLNDDTATGLTAPVNANGQATFNFGAGNALYAGDYSLSAQYLGTSADAGSTSADSSIAISLPSFTTTGDGLQEATVTPGSGPGAVTGQNVTMLYTGFYQSSGAEFDESLAHSPGTFSFTLNADPEQVISGFDEGATGIEIGETRVLVIPSDLGYMDGMVRTFVIQSVASGSQLFGSAAQLNVSDQPSSTPAGAAIATPIDVDVYDSNDNLVQTDSSTVSLSIASGPNGGTLGGTTSVAAQSGVATFSDLTFSLPGTYTLTASDGSLSSITSTPISVGGAAASSVTPTLGKVVLPSAAVAGVKITARVPVVVTNQGTALKGNVTVNVYADTTTSLDGNQVLVGTMTKKNLSLKANKTSAFNISIKSLPATLAAGAYYLLAEAVDPSGAINVTATTQTVAVAEPQIDLTGAITKVPVTGHLGKSIAVTMVITSDGNVPTVGALQILFELSASASGGNPVQVAELAHKINIKPAGKLTLHFAVPVALGSPSGSQYVVAIIDPDDSFNESDLADKMTMSLSPVSLM